MNVPPGKYEVLLELNDPLFPDNPDYNILLLNKGIAEISTGLNNLDHTIVVKYYTVHQYHTQQFYQHKIDNECIYITNSYFIDIWMYAKICNSRAMTILTNDAFRAK